MHQKNKKMVQANNNVASSTSSEGVGVGFCDPVPIYNREIELNRSASGDMLGSENLVKETIYDVVQEKNKNSSGVFERAVGENPHAARMANLSASSDVAVNEGARDQLNQRVSNEGSTFKDGDENDTYYGGDYEDKLVGKDGNGELCGEGGDDVIEGGDGHDRLYGGNGSDTIDGVGSAAKISGGDGNDELYGGNGKDEISGDSGNDTIHGDRVDDYKRKPIRKPTIRPVTLKVEKGGDWKGEHFIKKCEASEKGVNINGAASIVRYG